MTFLGCTLVSTMIREKSDGLAAPVRTRRLGSPAPVPPPPLLAHALTPAGQRRADERWLVPEKLLPAEVLKIRASTQRSRSVSSDRLVHVLEDREPRHQPRRERRLPAGPRKPHRTIHRESPSRSSPSTPPADGQGRCSGRDELGTNPAAHFPSLHFQSPHVALRNSEIMPSCRNQIARKPPPPQPNPAKPNTLRRQIIISLKGLCVLHGQLDQLGIIVGGLDYPAFIGIIRRR